MAQSVIGALRVNLGLDSAKFSSGAGKAKTTAQKLGQALGRIAIGAAAATTAILALARRSANLIDEQAKLALSLGSSTASIQVLERAGQLAGVSFGVIEQATIALTRRLSQAATGTGPAIDALKTLGLTVDQLNAVPLDQRIALIQQQLSQFVPEAERAAVASALFGDRAGLIFSRIDPTTLTTAREELEKFQVLVSETDAQQIQATNDALSRLSLIATGLGNRIAVQLAPALERLADFLTRVTEKGSAFSKVLDALVANIDTILIALGALSALIAGKLVVSIGGAVAGFIGLANPVGLLVGLVGLLSAGALILVRRFGEQETASYDAKAGTEALNAALGTFATTAAPSAAKEAIDLANDNYTLARSSVDAAKAELAKAQAFKDSADAQNLDPRAERNLGIRADAGLDAARQKVADAEAALAEATNGRLRAVTAVTGADTFAAETQAILGDQLQTNVDVTTDLGNALGGAAANTDALAVATEPLAEGLTDFEQKADGLNGQLAGVFTDAITGAKSLREGIADLLIELGKAGLNAVFKNLLSGGSAGGGFGALLGSIIPGFASGTNFAPGGVALVGEQGPELVNLPRGSKVFDANRSASMMQPNVNVSPPPVVVIDDPRKIDEYRLSPRGEDARKRADRRQGRG